MAVTVHAQLCAVQGRAMTGASLPVPDSQLLEAETLAAGAGNLASTIAAPAGSGVVWRLTVRGGEAWAVFGTSPDATVGKRWQLPAGVWDFMARSGDKVAVSAVA